MTTYCIPPEELEEAVQTIGPLTMWRFERDGDWYKAELFWNEARQHADMRFVKIKAKRRTKR